MADFCVVAGQGALSACVLAVRWEDDSFTVLMVCWGQVSGIAAILVLSLDFYEGGRKSFISNDSESTRLMFIDEKPLAHFLPDWKGLFLCRVPCPNSFSCRQ